MDVLRDSSPVSEVTDSGPVEEQTLGASIVAQLFVQTLIGVREEIGLHFYSDSLLALLSDTHFLAVMFHDIEKDLFLVLV